MVSVPFMEIGKFYGLDFSSFCFYILYVRYKGGKS